jgi:hypothetical protein
MSRDDSHVQLARYLTHGGHPYNSIASPEFELFVRVLSGVADYKVLSRDKYNRILNADYDHFIPNMESNSKKIKKRP